MTGAIANKDHSVRLAVNSKWIQSAWASKTVLTATLLVAVAVITPVATACEVGRFFFGSEVDTIREQLEIGTTTLKSENRQILTVTGREACRWNAAFSDVRVEFTFLFDTLVNLRLSRPATTPFLYQWAIARFGPFDLPTSGAGDPLNRQLFRDDSEILVFYSMRPLGSGSEEVVEISSPRHARLFRKYFQEVEQLLEGGGIRP